MKAVNSTASDSHFALNLVFLASVRAEWVLSTFIDSRGSYSGYDMPRSGLGISPGFSDKSVDKWFQQPQMVPWNLMFSALAGLLESRLRQTTHLGALACFWRQFDCQYLRISC